MFDFGWGEIVVIGIVALIAIGPKELPTVLRTIGQCMGKVRRMATEFQGQFQEAMREAECPTCKKQVRRRVSEFASPITIRSPIRRRISSASRNQIRWPPTAQVKPLTTGEPPEMPTPRRRRARCRRRTAHAPMTDVPPTDAPPPAPMPIRAG